VPSFTKDSYVLPGDSSRAARVARLADFSRRVSALSRVASSIAGDHLRSPRERDEVLGRVESSLFRASAALSRGDYRLGARGLWSVGGPPGTDVRKDSTRTRAIT